MPGDRRDSRGALGRREVSTSAFESAALHAYSMPPEAISMPTTLYLYAQRVRILAGRYEAVHPRKFEAHEGSSLAEHRAALVAAVSGKRGQRYLKW